MATASRSLVVEDLSGAIKKLASMARHRVIISSLVGDGPFDRRIFQAIDRDLDRGPDYICVHNLLHQMRIYADVTFIDNGGDGKKTFMDLNDAVSGYRWMIGDTTHEEERRLRSYLEKHLEKTKEGYVLDYLHPVRWAILSTVMLGPSTPVCSEAFTGTRITQLSGAYVIDAALKQAKAGVSQGGGTMLLKKSIRFASARCL